MSDMSPLASFATGAITIALFAGGLIGFGLVLSRLSFPRPLLHWFAVGCAAMGLALFALMMWLFERYGK